MTDRNPDITIDYVKRAVRAVNTDLTTDDRWSDTGKALKRAERALSSAMDALNLTPYEKLRDAVGNYMGEVGPCEIVPCSESTWCSETGCDYCNMGRALAALDHEDQS